jgi:hypothetical protein
VSLPNKFTNSLRLPTIEKVKTENALEIEVIRISFNDDSQPTTSDPQSIRSLRPHIPLCPLSITSTSPSSTTAIDQPASNNKLKQFKCAKCWFRTNWCTSLHHHLKAKHGKMFANMTNVQKLDKADAARTLAAYDREHLRTNFKQATGESSEEILR